MKTNSKEKLRTFLALSLLDGDDFKSLDIKVSEFPCLKKYAEKLSKDMKGDIKTYTTIASLDRSWDNVFPYFGFYLQRDPLAFVFVAGYGTHSAPRRAWKWFKELERRGELD